MVDVVRYNGMARAPMAPISSTREGRITIIRTNSGSTISFRPLTHNFPGNCIRVSQSSVNEVSDTLMAIPIPAPIKAKTTVAMVSDSHGMQGSHTFSSKSTCIASCDGSYAPAVRSVTCSEMEVFGSSRGTRASPESGEPSEPPTSRSTSSCGGAVSPLVAIIVEWFDCNIILLVDEMVQVQFYNTF